MINIKNKFDIILINQDNELKGFKTFGNLPKNEAKHFHDVLLANVSGEFYNNLINIINDYIKEK